MPPDQDEMQFEPSLNARDLGGFVVVWRSILISEDFRDRLDRSIFIDLVVRACHKSGSFWFRNHHANLKRGQLMLALRQEALGWGMSRNTFWRRLQHLVNVGCIKTGTAGGTGPTIITICKYSQFQDVRQPAGTAGGTVVGQQWDTEQPSKPVNTKGGEKDPPLSVSPNGSRSLRACRIPSGFKVSPEMDRWIRGENSQGIDYTDRLSAGEELEKFVDYWKGVPGRQGLRTDWEATFRNRIRNSWKSEKGSTSYLDQLKGKTT